MEVIICALFVHDRVRLTYFRYWRAEREMFVESIGDATRYPDRESANDAIGDVPCFFERVFTARVAHQRIGRNLRELAILPKPFGYLVATRSDGATSTDTSIPPLPATNQQFS